MAGSLSMMKNKTHHGLRPVQRWGQLSIALFFSGVLFSAGQAQEKEKVKVPAKKVAVAAVDTKKTVAPSAPQGAVVLRNLSGQEIEANLLSAHGDTVKIQRVDDGMEFTVPVAMFDEFSVRQINSWIESDPEAVNYSVSISTEKNMSDSNTYTTQGREFETEKWSYQVTLTNLTRNALSDAVVEYRIIYDDEVEFARTVASPGKGGNQQEGQTTELPEMTFNDQVQFTTLPIEINSYKYDPVRGERERSRDAIKGIWVRVTKNGKVIGEYQSSPGALASVQWDNEDEIDIQVTNRFRDSFGSGSGQ